MGWPVYFVGLASAFSDCATTWLASRYPELVETNPLANPFLEAATVLGSQAAILHLGEKWKVNPTVTVALALAPAAVPFGAAANNIVHIARVHRKRAAKPMATEEVDAGLVDYEEGSIPISEMSEEQEYAEDIVNRVCFAYGAPSPPIRIVDIPSGYAGMYLHDSYGFVAIPEKHLSEATIAHECGHHLFHVFRPGECHGEGSPGYKECETVARMVESWWTHTGRHEW